MFGRRKFTASCVMIFSFSLSFTFFHLSFSGATCCWAMIDWHLTQCYATVCVQPKGCLHFCLSLLHCKRKHDVIRAENACFLCVSASRNAVKLGLGQSIFSSHFFSCLFFFFSVTSRRRRRGRRDDSQWFVVQSDLRVVLTSTYTSPVQYNRNEHAVASAYVFPHFCTSVCYSWIQIHATPSPKSILPFHLTWQNVFDQPQWLSESVRWRFFFFIQAITLLHPVFWLKSLIVSLMVGACAVH